MLKPIELRQYLERAVPKLRRSPENFKMFVAGGRLHTTGTEKLAWMYGYTLQLQFLDWTDHADVVVAPLLIWLRQHQFDVVDSPDKPGIRFNAEYLDAKCMDLVLDVDLTERVIGKPHESKPGALQLHHLDDRPPLHIPTQERWELYIQDEKVAEWDYQPNDPTTPEARKAKP